MDITAEQWSELFDAFPGPLALVLPDHKFARCNRAFCELVGYSEGELKHRRWQTITHPDDVEGDEQGAKQIADDLTRDSYVMDKRYLSRRGHIVQVRLFVCAVRETQGDHKFMGYFICAIGQPDTLPTLPTISRAPPLTLIQWAAKNPKDAIIVGLATALLLGKEMLAEVIKHFLQ